VQGSESDTRANRDDFFRSIAKIDGDDRSISSKDFTVFMQSEMKRANTNKTTAPIPEMFKAFDTNANGVIDRPEIDNDNIKQGLVYN
jgi:Ca2+-binding EF-hand superfamily protein